MSENPYDPPVAVKPLAQEPDHTPLTAKDAYNVVSDTVTGVNLRWSDNRFQAKFVFFSVVLAAFLASVSVVLMAGNELPWPQAALIGALVGAFIGLVFGILASGIFLMIFRAKQHLKGKHD